MDRDRCCSQLVRRVIKSGGAGYRSPYFSHAKRALYHLSYTPVLPRWAAVQTQLWAGTNDGVVGSTPRGNHTSTASLVSAAPPLLRAPIRSCGATDNASDYGSEDSRFESWQDRLSLLAHCQESHPYSSRTALASLASFWPLFTKNRLLRITKHSFSYCEAIPATPSFSLQLRKHNVSS